MLIPFLPYLLALAGVSVLMALPVEVAVAPDAVLAAHFLALPLLGVALGQLPERLLGHGRRASQRRRGAFLAGWLGLLAATTLPAALDARFSALGAEHTAALALLLLNFWLGDALASTPLHAGAPGGWRPQLARLGLALRMPLPILLLVLAGLALPAFSPTALPLEGEGVPWLRLLGGLAVLGLLATVVVPVLIRTCWGLRPLAPGLAATTIRAELEANGVRVAAVLAWPDAMLGSATAGVIGLLPRFRYLLISPALAAALTLEELRAVTAHEAAHLRHRHLWYFFAAVLSFIVAMQVLMAGVLWSGVLTGTDTPLWLLLVLELAALVLFFRFGMGYVSRHFERQADGHALRRASPEALEGALLKVGLLNGIPEEQASWHHFGIGQRIGFAHDTHADPAGLARHDRKVARIKLALVAVLVLALGGQAATSSPAATDWLGSHYLAWRLDDAAELSEADLLPLQYLATRAVRQGDHAAAERYFRSILSVTPADAQAQNNLAWVLVTQPHARLAELREGLRLARQAADIENQAYIWDTLAESHYRLREYEAAIHAASKALLLAEQGAGRGEAPLRYYRERLAAFSRHGRGV